MMRSKAFSLLFFFGCFFTLEAQVVLQGRVLDIVTGKGLNKAEVYNKLTGRIVSTGSDGMYFMEMDSVGQYPLIIFAFGYEVQEKVVAINGNELFDFYLQEISNELTEVEISQQREQMFAMSRT